MAQPVGEEDRVASFPGDRRRRFVPCRCRCAVACIAVKLAEPGQRAAEAVPVVGGAAQASGLSIRARASSGWSKRRRWASSNRLSGAAGIGVGILRLRSLTARRHCRRVRSEVKAWDRRRLRYRGGRGDQRGVEEASLELGWAGHRGPFERGEGATHADGGGRGSASGSG